MTNTIRSGQVDWHGHREKGSGVYKLTGYDTITGNPVELQLTGVQLFTLAKFLPGLIAADADFFADYNATLLKRR